MRTIPFIVALLWLALLPQQLLAYYCPKTQTSDLPFSSVNTYSMGHETISTTQGTWSLEYHCPRGQFQTSASRLEGGVLADELYESGSYGTTKPQRSPGVPDREDEEYMPLELDLGAMLFLLALAALYLLRLRCRV